MSALACAEERHTLNFDIDGAYLANLVRDWVREGRWERALKLLLQDLEGMTPALAIAILKGEATLTGRSSHPDGIGYQMLPTDGEIARGMHEQIQFLYGQTFHYRDRYWKAYAQVTSWAAEDMIFARKGHPSHVIDASKGTRSERYPGAERRSLFYANSPERDLLVMLSLSTTKDVDILCEEAPMPPLWLDVPNGQPESIVRDLLAKGWDPEVRGAAEAGLLSESEPSQTKQAPDTMEELSTSAPSKAPVDFEAQAEADERAYQARIGCMRDQVREQAAQNGGYFTLALRDHNGKPIQGQPDSIEIPRHPFLLWALRGAEFEAFGRQRPKWNPVSPQGFKMMNDDRHHTDWVLGAGLDPDVTYHRDEDSFGALVMSCALSERMRLTEEWTGAEFVVLAHSGKQTHYSGPTVIAQPHRSVPAGCIALAPNASPAYQQAMWAATQPDKVSGDRGLLICETGGQLAHLAIVGRELGCTVLMLPGAIAKYGQARSVSVDLKTKRIYQFLF